ncbi:unnamed protein product [Aphanomyces euteiches]
MKVPSVVSALLFLSGCAAAGTSIPAPYGVTQTLTYADRNPDDPYDTEWKRPSKDIVLYPETQNIPLDNLKKHLRPPAPRIPDSYDIFVGLSSFRDGARCGYTLFTGFQRANKPSRLFFGVVDQVLDDDPRCIEEYCKLANEEWPYEKCRYHKQIRVEEFHADEARGPVYARHLQQQMIEDEEFCLQLDAHSVFTNDWDIGLVSDWKTTHNEMAVLSTYIHDLRDFIHEDGSNKAPYHLPHNCQTTRGTNGLVRTVAADIIVQPKFPQLTALWAGGFSFSKCHAEKRVPVDPHMLWMFDGEEFLRASHLWTAGYDIYSPSRTGSVVYHNYTQSSNHFERIQVDAKQHKKERTMAENRFRLVFDWPFMGEVDTFELTTKYAMGKTRSLQDYLEFSGVTFNPEEQDKDTCRQLYWVPYTDPSEVEELLGDWKMGEPEKPTTEETPKLQALRGISMPSDQMFAGGFFMVAFVVLAYVVFTKMPKRKDPEKSNV